MKRIWAGETQLPELIKRVRALEKRVRELEERRGVIHPTAVIDPRAELASGRAGRPLFHHRARGDDRSGRGDRRPRGAGRPGARRRPRPRRPRGDHRRRAAGPQVPRGHAGGRLPRRRFGGPRVRDHPSRHPRGPRHHGGPPLPHHGLEPRGPRLRARRPRHRHQLRGADRAHHRRGPRDDRRPHRHPSVQPHRHLRLHRRLLQGHPGRPALRHRGRRARGRALGQRGGHAPRRDRRRLAAAGAGPRSACSTARAWRPAPRSSGCGRSSATIRWSRGSWSSWRRPSAGSSPARAGAAAIDAEVVEEGIS